MPGVNVPWAVYQRWPAAPALAPVGAYVYHAMKSVAEPGLTAIVNP